ncbi:MAG: hypothetical protein Fur0015_12570 [Ignavibacteriales bacterium]
MNLFFDVVIIILLFALFGISHSFLASDSLKKKLAEKIGNRIAFYRLFYNVSSFFLFIVIYEISPKPDVMIYDLDYPIDIIILALQVFPIAGLIWSMRQNDLKEFLGINQIIRYLRNEYDYLELDEKSVFRKDGAYKYSRHPIYFFSIIFLLLRPSMDLFYLTFVLILTAYFFVGSIYEERKLISKFGNDYLVYREQVPRIFPKIF